MNRLGIAAVLAMMALLWSAGCGTPPEKVPSAPPIGEVPPDTPWPVNDTGVVFRFETASFKAPILAFDKAGQKLVAYSLTAKGRAWHDRNFALVLSGGSYVAERAGAYILDECRKSGALTIEALVTPGSLSLEGLAPIISFASSPDALNFALTQKGSKLLLDLRTSVTRGGGAVELCALRDTAPCHLVITYESGALACYVNGAAVSRNTEIEGDFSGWGEHDLVFGSDGASGQNWTGTLEGIALYSRAISAEDAAIDNVVYRRTLQERAPVRILEARAKLVAKTIVPEPASVLPYTRILVAYEYEIEKITAGDFTPGTIRVTHWGIMEKQVLPISERPIGQSYDLRLEPFEDNPQLESEWLHDDLPAGDLDTFYDAAP